MVPSFCKTRRRKKHSVIKRNVLNDKNANNMYRYLVHDYPRLRTYSEVTYGTKEGLVRKCSCMGRVKDSELFESLTQYTLAVIILPATNLLNSSCLVFSIHFFRLNKLTWILSVMQFHWRFANDENNR